MSSLKATLDIPPEHRALSNTSGRHVPHTHNSHALDQECRQIATMIVLTVLLLLVILALTGLTFFLP